MLRRFSLGRLGRRKVGGDWSPGRPFGRGEIVAEFHSARRRDQPPVFVIQGVRGSQKSELLDHLQYSFQLRRSSGKLEDLAAKVDFFVLGSEPELAFASINSQLRRKSSFFRRLRTPRFARVQAVLVEERRRRALPLTQVGDAQLQLDWLAARAATKAAASQLKAPIPAPSKDGSVLNELRRAWWRISPTPAGRWVRKNLKLPDEMSSPGAPRERQMILQDSLASATAEDLRVATRRRLLPIGEVALFVDGYHHVEHSVRPGFIAKFAESIWESKARVMLVVACREPGRWGRLADEQDDCQDFPAMRVSDRIQIHLLQPLSSIDRAFALYKRGVAPDIVEELADRSAGVPIALDLLGASFGRIKDAGPRLQALREEIPDPDPDRTGIDADEWLNLYGRTIAEDIVRELEPGLVLHLRAASTLRNFDRRLLRHLLGSQFSGRAFDDLVAGTLVGPSRPSPILGVDDSYRVRSHVREIFTADPSEPEDTDRWHDAAADYLGGLAEQATDGEVRFQLEAEGLYHRLFTETEEARVELFRSFQVELLAARTDRCEAILQVARDYDRIDPQWRALVLTNAGKMYLARDRIRLAQDRLREAKRLVSFDSDPELAATVSLALARSYRIVEDFREAREEFALLKGRQYVHPVIRFQCVWAECLEARDAGHLGESRIKTEEARELLGGLLEAPHAARNLSAAESFGLGPLTRKRAHIVRHEADLARRSGDYVLALAKVDEALELYRDDQEDGIEEYTELVHAHVLRQLGESERAYELADEIYGRFASSRPRDLRGAAWALNCKAQARLTSSEPEAALPLLEDLLAVDPLVYPRGERAGLFGKAELLKLEGKDNEAARFYERSELGVHDQRANIDRSYSQLGRIWLGRGQLDDTFDREVFEMESRPGNSDHPVLVFYTALLQVRVGTPGDHVVTAEQAAGRIKRPSGSPDLESRLLRETVEAIALDEKPPSVIFNLP